MIIKVRIGGPLRSEVKGLENGLIKLDLEEGATLSRLLDRLGLKPERVRAAMVNHRPVRSDQILREGDRVGLFPAECGAINEISIYFHQPLRDSGPGNP